MAWNFLLMLLCLCLHPSGDASAEEEVYENRYGRFFVPVTHDRPAVRAIKSGLVYELKTLLFIQKIYPPGTDIVHAGAYFGDMLPFFSKLVGDRKVWAFEPVRGSYLYAERNRILNGLQNVTLFPFALSDSSGHKVMEIIGSDGAHNGGGSYLTDPGANFQSLVRYEEVQSVRLDDILAGVTNPIGVIHFDVEGHEVLALRGALKTIKKYRPVVMVEAHPKKLMTVNRFMKRVKYTKVASVDGNYVFIPG